MPYLEKAGITLVVEPLNIRIDHKGYYLYSSDEAAEVIKEVDSSNVKMLFDIYHQQITEGDLIRRIREYILISDISTAPGILEGMNYMILKLIIKKYSRLLKKRDMTDT